MGLQHMLDGQPIVVKEAITDEELDAVGFGPVDLDAEKAHADLAKANRFRPPPNPAGEKPAERKYDQQDYTAAQDRMGRDGLAVASGADATEKFARYTADQHLFNVTQTERKSRRANNVAPSAMAWVNAKMVAINHLYVDENYAWHEAVLAVLLAFVVGVIRNVPRFVLAHVPLYVRPARYRSRKSACGSCTYRREKFGTTWCDAIKDAKLCSCPQTPAWPLASLGYMLALASFGCPLGKFGRARVWYRGLVVAGVAAWLAWRYVL